MPVLILINYTFNWKQFQMIQNIGIIAVWWDGLYLLRICPMPPVADLLIPGFPKWSANLLIAFSIWTNTFYNLYKYILWFGQIHFVIWTKTFCDLDKHILQSGQIHLANLAVANLEKSFVRKQPDGDTSIVLFPRGGHYGHWKEDHI